MTNGRKTFLIEIETGKSDVAKNLRKCAGTSGQVVVFFTSKQAFAAHQPVLADFPNVVPFCPETLPTLQALLLA